jgi:hypothetical protein
MYQEEMTPQQAEILRACIYTSMDIFSGRIKLHKWTLKQVAKLEFNDMVIEEPKVWDEPQ